MKHQPVYRGRPEFQGTYMGLIPMGLIFIFFGLLPFSLDFPWWMTLRAKFWQSAPATIVASENFQLLYRYQWQGFPHSGSRYAFGNEFAHPGSDRRQNFIAAHKVGDKITVLVNPTSPEQAVVDPSLDGDIGTFLFDMVFVVGFGLVGIGILGTGVWLLFCYIRDLRRFEAAD